MTRPLDFAVYGLHLFRDDLPPDAWLEQLNPQVLVLVGSYEHMEAVDKTRAVAQRLVDLLPDTLIKIRWWPDDHILDTITPEGFAQLFFKLHVPGTLLGVGNEDAAGDAPTLQATVAKWTAVTRLATAAKIPLAIGSVPFGVPEYGLYELIARLWQAMADGRAQGVYHVWTPNTYLPVRATEADVFHMGERHEREMLRVCAAMGIEPPPMFHGEYNLIRNQDAALDGPVTLGLPAEQWVEQMQQPRLRFPRAVYAHGDGLYDSRWAGFNVKRRTAYMDALAGTLSLPTSLPRTPFPFLEQWRTSVAAKRVYDLMDYLCPPNGRQYRLIGMGDESCQCVQAADGWIEFRKNRHMEEFYVTASVIGRGADTSLISRDGVHPDGTFYIQYTRGASGALTYGAAWAKRQMAVGETFHRDAHIVIYSSEGSVIKEYDEASDLLLRAHHASISFPSGITLSDVLEFQWGGEEVYYYGKDFGLVGWKNLRTDEVSGIGALGAAIQAPFSHAVARPVVPMPPALPTPAPTSPTLPDPQNYGDLIDVLVVSTSSPDGANIRQAPSLTGAILAVVKKGDQLKARIATPYPAAGYKWVVVETINGQPVKSKAGQIAAGYLANVALLAPIIDAAMEVDLKAPYVSQLGAGANVFNNDCLIPSIVMDVRQWHTVQQGLPLPTLPTVDDLGKHTALTVNDKLKKGLTFADGIMLARALGFEAEYHNDLTPAKIVDLLRAGVPVIVLVNYGVFNPADTFDGSHFALVDGFNSAVFKVQDPYHGGPNFLIARDKLDEAMRVVPGNAGSYQGLTLKVR